MTTSWALIGGIAAVLMLPTASRLARRAFDPFEPIVLFALAYGAMFIVRPIAMITGGEMQFWGVDVSETFPRMLLIALVGAVGFVLGYEYRLGQVLAGRLPRPPVLDTRAGTATALVLAAIGAALFVLVLPASDARETLAILTSGRSDEFGEILRTTSTYLWYGSWLLVPASIVLVGLALRERSPRRALLAAGVVALALARLLPLGDRIVLLPLVGGCLVLAYTLRDRRPGALVLTVAAVAALSSSYVVLTVRDGSRSLGDAMAELARSPQDVAYPVLHGADAEMPAALAAALTVVPGELGYRFGAATVGDLAFRPVPRQVWADKPRPPGQDIVLAVWPQHYPYLDPAFSPLLPLYLDFWLAGVVTGMALFGLASRVLFAWFRIHRHDFVAQITFATGVWFAVVGARNSPVDTVVVAAFIVLPVVIVAAVAGTRPVGTPQTLPNVGAEPAKRLVGRSGP